MTGQAAKTIKAILESLFRFCREERFAGQYREALRLFMDISPDRDLDSIGWAGHDETNFLMWFCFEKMEESKTIGEIWLEENPDLPPDIAETARRLNRSNVAVYYPVPDKSTYESLTLKDMFSGNEIEVWEPVIWQLRDKPLVYGLRLIEKDGGFISAGDFYVFPREISDDIIDFFHRHLQGFYGEEIKKPAGFPRGSAYLLNHLRITLQRSDEFIRVMKEKIMAGQQEVVSKIVCHFLVRDYEAAIDRIQMMETIAYLDENNEYRFYEWWEDSELTGKDDPNAGIALGKMKMVAHCRDFHSAEVVKTALISELGDSVKHIYDTVMKRKS
ncbi:MAG: hypothetical protein LWY06_00490 [Firmicutes bacterium]|nr:hypothetical protein [Bacillota bacterium]